jgi:hypothetical protein
LLRKALQHRVHVPTARGVPRASRSNATPRVDPLVRAPAQIDPKS